MTNSIIQEGGPLHARRIGGDQYEMKIDIPKDEHGMVARQCVDESCSPGYFKVKPGTGITEGQIVAYCPYCRRSDEPHGFHAQAQKDYAVALVRQEAQKGIDRILRSALGLGSSGRKTIGRGFVSLEISYKPSRPGFVSRPLEEELRRDVACPNCSLEHTVFGLATWCPDCGRDIFLVHVEEELGVVRKILAAVDDRRNELGTRVAARDVENSLEDVVSIFEAVLKIITRRNLLGKGLSVDEVSTILERTVRNSYQNARNAAEMFRSQVGLELYEGISVEQQASLSSAFEKRHPITHNLGVVDRKYLERAESCEMEGREVHITAPEVLQTVEIVSLVIRGAYERTFGSSPQVSNTEGTG